MTSTCKRLNCTIFLQSRCAVKEHVLFGIEKKKSENGYTADDFVNVNKEINQSLVGLQLTVTRKWIRLFEWHLCLVPDVFMTFDIEAMEVVVFNQPLLLLLVFAVLQAFHDGQLHLHGDVDRQHRLQQVLLQNTKRHLWNLA